MFRRCAHERVRCIHGDEINDRKGRRRACLDCGRSLEGELPNPCSWTGKPHLSQAWQAADRAGMLAMKPEDFIRSAGSGDSVA